MAAAMAYRKVPYDPSRDFLRVRDFLAATIHRLGTLFTWDISRWNYARHFVVPYRGGSGGHRDLGGPDRHLGSGRRRSPAS